jgi:hypothetical protein
MAKARKLLPKVDGLGPNDVAKLRAACRQVWHRSHVRKLAAQRAVGDDGFPVCELCKETVPKVFIDHIERVGDMDGGFIQRLFCPSSGLQALCKTCHQKKTNAERKMKKESNK